MTWKVATEEVLERDAADRIVEGGVIAHAYDPDTGEQWPGAAAGKLACDKSTAGMTIWPDERGTPRFAGNAAIVKERTSS